MDTKLGFTFTVENADHAANIHGFQFDTEEEARAVAQFFADRGGKVVASGWTFAPAGIDKSKRKTKG